MSGENIKLTCPLCHELWKMVLSIPVGEEVSKLWVMSHVFMCFVILVIQGGPMAKFWPLHHYNQCIGENGRKTLSTARGRGGVSI